MFYGIVAHRRRVQAVDVHEVPRRPRLRHWQCIGGFDVRQLRCWEIQCWGQHWRVLVLFAHNLSGHGRIHRGEYDDGQLVFGVCQWIIQRARGCAAVHYVANHSMCCRGRIRDWVDIC